MADSPRHPDTGIGPDPGMPPRMPRWVKWPAIIIGLVVLLFVVLKLTGHGGEHGPGRHMSGGDALSSVTQEYVRLADGAVSHDPSRWSLR